MKRLVFSLLFLFIFPSAVLAQTNTPVPPTPVPHACWSNTRELGPIYGSYPNTTIACLDDSSWVSGVTSTVSYKCGTGSAVAVHQAEFSHDGNYDWFLENSKFLLFLPPSEMYHPNRAPRLRFHVFFYNDLYSDAYYSYGDNPRINDQIKISFITPTGYSETTTEYLTYYNYYVARINIPLLNQASEYIVYEVDVSFDVSEDVYWNGYGGFWRVQMSHAGGLQGDSMMIGSLQLAGDQSAYLPPMCAIQGLSITPTPAYPPTATAGGPTFTPSPSPYPTSPAAATSTPRPWPTETARPYVTLIPEPMATTIVFPTLVPITFPTIHWPSVPTVAVTATPTPAVAPTSTPPPTIDSIATLNGNIEVLATQWAEPIGLANSYLLSETLVLSDTTLAEGASGLMETIALPFRLFKTAQIYSPSTWPFYAAILVSIAVVLGVQLIRFALMIVFFFFEVFRHLWEMLPLN